MRLAVALAMLISAGLHGCSDSTSPVNQPPSATFSYAPSPPVAGEPVTLTGEATDPDGTVTGWEWDFGDGASAQGQEVTHTFAAPGAHTVTLTVTDDGGETGAVSDELVVVQRITYGDAAGIWVGDLVQSGFQFPHRILVSLSETAIEGTQAGDFTYWFVRGRECSGTWPAMAGPGEEPWTLIPELPDGCPRTVEIESVTLSHDPVAGTLSYEGGDSEGELTRPDILSLTPLIGTWAGTAVDFFGEFPLQATFHDSEVLRGGVGGEYLYWLQESDPDVDDPVCSGVWVALSVEDSVYRFAEYQLSGPDNCPSGTIDLVLDGDILNYSFDHPQFPATGSMTKQ